MLIVFEGLHTAGKSTQVTALVEWLRDRDVTVTQTSWNSSPPVGATITALKMANALGPVAMVLLEAADLAYRYEQELRDALAAGVVIADRWTYSTVVRALPRGVDRRFVDDCFAFAPRPDLVFHLRCRAATTLRRRVVAGLPLQGPMVGEDLEPGLDPYDGYLRYQGEAARLYDSVLPPDAVVLSCDDGPGALQEQVISVVAARLPGSEEPHAALR